VGKIAGSWAGWDPATEDGDASCVRGMVRRVLAAPDAVRPENRVDARRGLMSLMLSTWNAVLVADNLGPN